MSEFEISGRKIGIKFKPFIIAELSANHNNDFQRAIDTIDFSVKAGASAVKLQTYSADSLTIDSNREDFKINEGLWEGRSLYELYQEASTPWDWHERLFEYAHKVGVIIFSSAFDSNSVDLLMDISTPAFKVASFELVDIPLIRYIAKTGRPIIMSTGLASLTEMEEAVSEARDAGCEKLALLHCISGYPTPLSQANLSKIGDMRERFGVEIGFSDHTLGVTASVTAVALGASIIEKHVIKSRSEGGPDAQFSVEPVELEALVRACNEAHECVGSPIYSRVKSESQNQRFRRSLYAVADIAVGESFTRENVRSIRPSFGLHPRYLEDLLGKTARCPIKRGQAMEWSFVNSEQG